MARQAQMLAAVLLSIVISAIASWLFHGRVGADFVITGGVAGLIVNLLIARLTRGLRDRNRRLEREILEREGELRAIRAAAELAHEVRNPLSAVLGNLELALELIADPTAAEGAVAGTVRDAYTAAQHMYALLSDLRRTPAAGLRRGEAHAHVQDAALAARAMALAHLRHSVQIEVAGVHDCPPIAVGDAHLVQILHNLVLNAAHASRPDAPNVITICHAVDGDAVHVVVADLGAGMPPEVVARVFEPGFTTRRASGGSGFGLAIVRQLVEAAGGRVAVHSTPGVGTEVHLWIPVAANAPAPGRSPDSLDPATGAAG